MSEDHIALVIPDLSNIAAQITVILGTPNISLIITCDEGTRDRHLGNALGNMPGWHISYWHIT